MGQTGGTCHPLPVAQGRQDKMTLLFRMGVGAASLLQGRVGREFKYCLFTFRQKSQAQLMLCCSWCGGICKSRHSARDPSLAESPPHTAEQQEQPAHRLETPLPPPHQTISRAQPLQAWIRQGRFFPCPLCCCELLGLYGSGRGNGQREFELRKR